MIYYLHKNRNFIEKINRQQDEDKLWAERADFMDKVMASKRANPKWPDDISSGIFNKDRTASDYYGRIGESE